MCIALFSESPRALQLAERHVIVINTMQLWILRCSASAGGGTWLPQPVPDKSRSAADAAAAACELEFVSLAQAAPPQCGYTCVYGGFVAAESQFWLL